MIETKTITAYKCNLCFKEIIEDKGSGFKREPIISSEFDQADFHLCNRCITYIKMFAYTRSVSFEGEVPF